ncbi:MAG: hypothetical protein O3B72_11650 [Proteobacteria bacterium]|nr:hypothetical protein [Pseudomonadota bacterium]
MINDWQAEALNTAPDSPNEIHGDQLAQQFGFKGGLVPGVTISAYLIHPAVETWGMAFLEKGKAHVTVRKPLYDGDKFTVRILSSSDSTYQAELVRSDGVTSASAEISIEDDAPAPLTRLGAPIAACEYVGPPASPAAWEKLRQEGCLAFRYPWGSQARMKTYLRNELQMPELLSGTRPYANMGFLLGISNWVLAGNAHMNPWVHLETSSQNYRPVPWGTSVIGEMEVRDYYEKRGHRFVDAEVALYDEADDSCLSSISLRAIYQLRGA